ncbi:MAG: sigma-70 family RNA polymerase sigma factor [Chloroflexi bacterium]|nr:sigma-70 family RNA polymerase sigma factor [Chloroflexota bacterium]
MGGPASGPFEAVFAQHYPRVQRVLAGLLGADEADDAAQEVFLQLYHRRLIDQPDAAIGAWLYRVALNTAYNRLRSRRRQATHLDRIGQLARSDVSHDEAALNPAQAAVAAEEARLVRAALTALSPTHRNVLVLRHAGLSYAEVAAAASVRPGSVGTLLARAEAHLRDHYLRLAGETSAQSHQSVPPGGRP